MGLAGAGASIDAARADTAPPPEAVDPPTQTGGSDPIDDNASPTNTGPGDHEKHPGHKKRRHEHHHHRWQDALSKRLEAMQEKIRQRIEDLQSRGAHVLDGVDATLRGDLPARTTPEPTNTSGAPGFNDDDAATDAPADPSSP